MTAIRRLFAVAVVGVGLASTGYSQEVKETGPQFKLKKVTSLPASRQMHGSAVVGNRLYIFGGNVELVGWVSDVLSAEIKNEGDLGPWRSERGMPERRSYIGNSVVAVNDRIYIVGGSNYTMEEGKEVVHQTKDVLWTKVQSDGTLAEWKKSEPFPGLPLTCTAACASDTALYLIGGISGVSNVTDTVLVAAFNEDGSLRPWRNASALPVKLWFQGASLQDKRLYVWGGLTNESSASINNKTFSASVGTDDLISTWRSERDMPSGVYSSAFIGANEYLVSLGGRYVNSYPTTAIWYSRLKDGAVEEWQLMRSDLQGTVYTAAALDKARGIVYVSGGRRRIAKEEGPILDSVQGFRLVQPSEKRLPVLPASSVPGRPDDNIAETDLEKYPTVTAALETAKKESKQVLVIFYSPEVPNSRKMRDAVLAHADFKSLVSKYVLAGADVSGRDAALPNQYRVFRVPTMAVLSSDNTVIKRSQPILTIDDLKAFLIAKE